MYYFGRRSQSELSSCDPKLQRLADLVIQIKDHSVIKGHRGKSEQNEAYQNGYSKLKWPDGKHNKYPSVAMDVQVYPRPADEQALREEQLYLLGIYRGAAAALGIGLRTGADFDRDGEVIDSGFFDGFHVELD